MTKPLHRGAGEDWSAFAPAFVRGRLVGFEKDVTICLKPIPKPGKPGEDTHAYFPLLTACTGTLEYLTALAYGYGTKAVGWDRVANFTKRYMSRPQDYDRERMEVLYVALRNPVAHRGIASGVWAPRKGANKGRRFVWTITEYERRPALQIVEKEGILKTDSPWPCRFTHRLHIHLKALALDIRDAAVRYADRVAVDRALQANFEKCMVEYYPRERKTKNSVPTTGEPSPGD